MSEARRRAYAINGEIWYSVVSSKVDQLHSFMCAPVGDEGSGVASAVVVVVGVAAAVVLMVGVAARQRLSGEPAVEVAVHCRDMVGKWEAPAGWQRVTAAGKGRVVASYMMGRIDRVIRSNFGFAGKSPPENFFGGGGVVAVVAGRRWLPAAGE
nr:hypothetical protein [Tanacetum cinerariifolium]